MLKKKPVYISLNVDMKYHTPLSLLVLTLPEEKEWQPVVQLVADVDKTRVDDLRMCNPGRHTEASGKKHGNRCYHIKKVSKLNLRV